jgi:hypothetical protein
MKKFLHRFSEPHNGRPPCRPNITLEDRQARRPAATLAAAALAIGFALFQPACATRTGLAMSTLPAAELRMSVAEGQPPRMHSGANQAYWVWKDENGIWHLRETTQSVRRHFQGRIRASGGAQIVDLRGFQIGAHDWLALEGRDIVFDLDNKQHIDGFDFRVNGGGCLEFDLRIDHSGDGNRIYIGKTERVPKN